MDITHAYECMRPYQKEAYHKLLTKPRMLNFDDMGLGKTIVTLAAVEKQITSKKQKVLILCPTYALYVWSTELTKWFGRTSVVYTGGPKKREKIWDEFVKSDCDYMITTYGMQNELFNKKTSFMWFALIADEIHTAGLLNRKTKTWAIFEKAARDIPLVYQLTGTPVRQGLDDLYAPLHVVNNVLFHNYYAFVNRWCITITTAFGRSIERNPAEPDKWREVFSRYHVRRIKNEVLKELPGKQRQPLYVEMTAIQKKLYDSLVKDMFATYNDVAILTPNKMTMMMRLRQLLVCPRLLGFDDDGAALTELVAQSTDIINNDRPVIVFTPFAQALPFIEDALLQEIPTLEVVKIQGGMSPEQFRNAWQGFESSKKKRALICVIKSGASFTVTSASEVFFLGYEWDFNYNIQSEDRAYRMGQEHFVNVYYMMHKDTVDEDVMQRLDEKIDASLWAIGSEEQYNILCKRYGVKERK